MSALPPRPNLSQLKSQAKDLLKKVLGQDEEVCSRVRAHHPEYRTTKPLGFSLQDAQLVLAREYGYPSWPRLVAALKSDGGAAPAPGPVPTRLDQVTAAYLTELMRTSGVLPQGEIRAFELQVCADDVPLRQTTASVGFDYAAGTTPSAPRQAFLQLNFDHGVRPQVALLRAADAAHPSVLPACYGMDYDLGRGESALLLQDLKATHRRVCEYVKYGDDPVLPADEDLDAVVDTLAAFHAYWWEDDRLDRTDFARGPWWGDDDIPLETERRQREYAEFTAGSSWLAAADRQLCDRLLGRCDGLFLDGAVG